MYNLSVNDETEYLEILREIAQQDPIISMDEIFCFYCRRFSDYENGQFVQKHEDDCLYVRVLKLAKDKGVIE